MKQECIPVGCVPAARRPYAGVCFPGGVCSGGVCSGGVSAPEGSAPRGVSALGGVCSQGVSAPGGSALGGVSAPGVSAPGGCLLPGGVYPSMHWGRHSPLLTESQMPVKTLPWPNFVAAGNNGIFAPWTCCTSAHVNVAVNEHYVWFKRNIFSMTLFTQYTFRCPFPPPKNQISCWKVYLRKHNDKFPLRFQEACDQF